MEEWKVDKDTLGSEVCLQQCNVNCFTEILLIEYLDGALGHDLLIIQAH